MTLPVRHAFDIPDDIVYLNCAYQGPLSRDVAAVGAAAMTRKARPWEITAPDFFDDVERFRDALATLTGLDADGFAIVPSVSYGLSTAAHNIELRPTDEILVMAEQFPSNVYPWREAARRAGARVVTAARSPGGDPTSTLVDAIGPATAAVAIAPCHWTDGARIDLGAVRAALPDRAKLILDTAQSLGAIELDLAAIAPDVVAGTTYKWLLGPYSLGFVWLSPEARSGSPIEYSWIARAGSENFAGLVDYRDEYRPGARRFDMGEVSNFALLPAGLRAIEQIIGWGPSAIAAHASALTGRAIAGAAALGCGAVPEPFRSPHLSGLLLPDRVDPVAVADALSSRRVYVSVRGRSVRVSAHVYNTTDDVDALVDALGDVLA